MTPFEYPAYGHPWQWAVTFILVSLIIAGIALNTQRSKSSMTIGYQGCDGFHTLTRVHTDDSGDLVGSYDSHEWDMWRAGYVRIDLVDTILEYVADQACGQDPLTACACTEDPKSSEILCLDCQALLLTEALDDGPDSATWAKFLKAAGKSPHQ